MKKKVGIVIGIIIIIAILVVGIVYLVDLNRDGNNTNDMHDHNDDIRHRNIA